MKTIFSSWLILIAALVVVLDASAQSRALPRIAHAGGGFNSMTYTNSLDALEQNASHYRLFEIDFSFTSDWELVCIHDWDQNAKEVFGRKFSTPPSLAEFEALVERNSKFKNCTLTTLIAWLEAHPDKLVVTDVKSHNGRALSLIAERFPAHRDRFIPQIYHPLEYKRVQDLGYTQVIWTLYRYGMPADAIVEQAKKMKLFAVTMPTSRAEANLARRLQDELGIASYVHTINTGQELAKYRALGITEIYTDWLAEH